MKARANRADLAEALTFVGHAIAKRPQHPAMAGVRISASSTDDGEGLTLRAMDYEFSATALVEAEVIGEGEALASGHFLQLVGAMRGQTVDLTLDNGTMTLASGRATYRANSMPVEDYPNLPEFPARVGTVAGANLAAALAVVKAPIDPATPHPQVAGLRIEASGDGLHLVGASRFRISNAALSWEGEEFACQVPVRWVESAMRGLGAGPVEIGWQEGALGLATRTRAATFRTLAGDFTDWARLVRPEEKDEMFCTVDAAELLEVVKRAGLLVDETRPIWLDFAPDGIQVDADGAEFGMGEDFCPATCDGQIRLGFDPEYLGDALAAVPSGTVRIGFASGRQPVTIRPTEHPAIRFVVMPKTPRSN